MKKIAIALPLVWLGWLVLTDWVPMFPLNDLSVISVADRATAALANYPIPLLIAGAVALDRLWSRIAAVLLSALCIGGHLISWWIPYFGTATPSQREDYLTYYGRTLRYLPTEGHGVVIDVQHTVVGVIAVAMFVATVVFAVRRGTGRAAPAGHIRANSPALPAACSPES